MKNYPLLSLFSGAGGLDLGLEMAGFETRVATELEDYACDTLRFNQRLCNNFYPSQTEFFETVFSQRCYFKATDEEKNSLKSRVSIEGRNSFLQHTNIIQGDIRSLTSAALLESCKLSKKQELVLIAGGPPCQPFSRAGKREAVDDVRNGDLFFEFVRLVKDLNPRWFLFENVKGLLLTKTDVVSYKCSSCGYSGLLAFSDRMAWGRNELTPSVCPSCGKHGVKVTSESKPGGSLDIILHEFEKCGYKCQWNVLNAADFGAPQIRERLFIVGSRDNQSFNWPIRTHTNGKNGSSASQLTFDDIESKPLPWPSIYQAIWETGHPKYGVLNPKKAVLWVKNVVRPHAEPVTWPLSRPSPTIGAHQAAKLAIAPEGVPEEQLLRQQWHTKGKRQGDMPPVFVEHEYLSDEELLRIQTFPKWWYLHGTRMQRAFQIGNAVPPILARAVGEAIINADRGSKK